MTADLNELLEQPLPHNPDAERAILGGIILMPELIDQARRLMPPNWLFVPSHQSIYVAMLKLDEQRVEINPIMIAEKLKRQGQLEAVGGISFITNLTYGLPHSSNLSHYIDAVRKHAKARWGIKMALSYAHKLLEGGDEPDAVFENWVVELDKSRADTVAARRPKSLAEMHEDYALRLLLFHKGVSNAIPTGFPEVDEKLLGGGVIPSLTYVVAGRPSMGKSTFALDISANVADQGYRVLYVSREMMKESLMDRLAAAKSGVERFKISARISKDDYESVLEAVDAMQLVPLILDDVSESTQEIDHYITAMERTNQRVDMLVVDYLQLLHGDKGGGRTNEVSLISRDLKGIAMRHEIPVIEVSQLTRAPGKEHRAPELYDLRESGQIEQDADCVMFLHGDEPEEEVEFYQRELLCRKQRDGPHFHRLLDMNASLVTFRTPDILGLGTAIKRPGRIGASPTQGKKKVGMRDEKLIRAEASANASIDKQKREEFEW